MKVLIGDQKASEVKSSKNQFETYNSKMTKRINSIGSDNSDDNEPFQINLYSQKNQNKDKSEIQESNGYIAYQQNQYIRENKVYHQSFLHETCQDQESYLNSGIKNQNQHFQDDQISLQQNIFKQLSPKEGINNIKASQQGKFKHTSAFSVEDLNSNYNSETFNLPLYDQALISNNSQTLIEQQKLKYLKEVEKILTSSNFIQKAPLKNQGGEDILTQKMQLIEQKKKKLFQEANSEIKNLKIPLIIQRNDIVNKNKIHKKNNNTTMGYKKRLSLRDKPLKRKKFEDIKYSRLNKSMKTSNLSASFDLYCIYESKSEDSNDCSPPQSRNRSLFFKSERISSSQLGFPSAPQSPNTENSNNILNIMKNEDFLSLNSSKQQAEISKCDLVKNLQKLSNLSKNSLTQKISNEIIQSQTENQAIQDNNIQSIDQKNQSQLKNNKDLKNEQNIQKIELISKQTKQQIRKTQSTDQTSGRVQKNTNNHEKFLEQISNSNENLQNNRSESNIKQSQLKQGNYNQSHHIENVRSSFIQNKENGNIQLNDQIKDQMKQQLTSSVLSPSQISQGSLKKELQQKIVIYDLKNSNSIINEKQIKMNLEKEDQVKIKYNKEEIQIEQFETDINIKNTTQISSSRDSEDNNENQIGLNVINLYRKCNSDQPLSTQNLINQGEIISNETIEQNNRQQINQKNSSLTNTIISGQNNKYNSIQISQNLEKSQNTALHKLNCDSKDSVSRIKELSQNHFMTDDEVSLSHKISSDPLKQFQNESQTQKNIISSKQKKQNEKLINLEQEANRNQQQTNGQAQRYEFTQFEKNNQKQENDQSQQQISKSRKNSFNQMKEEIQSSNTNQNQFKQYSQSNLNRLNIQNSLLVSSQVAENNTIFKKNENQQKLQTSSYRDLFKQKLEQKNAQLQNNNCYNISVYISNTNNQISRQNSQSPKAIRKQSSHYEKNQNSQVNSPSNKKSDNIRSSMNSSINKSKPQSELNSPVQKPQQPKLNEQSKLQVIKLQQNQITQNTNNTRKNYKNQVQQNNTDQETNYYPKQKSMTAEQFFTKTSQKSPRRDQKIWQPESLSRQTTSMISQLETQVSNLQSTKKTYNDTDNSHNNDNCKPKKNIQISDFYKDLNLFENKGHSHHHTLSLPQPLVESTKNDKNKKTKDEFEILSIPNVSSIKSSTQSQQNNFFVSPIFGQIGVKKQVFDGAIKKEITIQPVQENPQKTQQKKNKFNVESKVKNYIQAGQISQTQLKIIEQPNFHIVKGAGIQSQSNKYDINGKSLYQESIDTQKYFNQNKKSTTIINNCDIQGSSINPNNYTSQNHFEQSEKNPLYQIKSNTINKHKTKEQLKYSLQSSMNSLFQSQNPSKSNSINILEEGEQNDKQSHSDLQSQVQQQMQVQRQQAAEQIQKAQQSIYNITQNIDTKNQTKPVVYGQNMNNRVSQHSNK